MVDPIRKVVWRSVNYTGRRVIVNYGHPVDSQIDPLYQSGQYLDCEYEESEQDVIGEDLGGTGENESGRGSDVLVEGD